MIDAKDAEKEPATCPFSKLKNTKLKSSKKTPCPIVNALINAGELDPNREWTMKEVRNALQENKLTSSMFSKVFTLVLSIILPSPPSVKTIQKIGHDVSFSREDYHLGDHIHYSDKRFKIIYKYFKHQKYITLKELIEYMHYLYKKSKKENSKFNFGIKQSTIMLLEMVMIFRLLSENDRLELKKLEKVCKEETVDNVKINTINMVNFSINMIKAINYWNYAKIKDIYKT